VQNVRGTAVAAAGLTSALAGLIGAGFALFGPFYEEGVCDSSGLCTHWTESLVEHGLPGLALGFLVLMMLLFGLLAASAVSWGLAGTRRARRVMWGCALLLVVGVWATALTVGPFLLPAVVFALAASVMALSAHPAR
jgi:hypothetical protein